MADEDKKNMFVYVSTYDSREEADEDYRALLELHKEGWVGTYDVGVVVKSEDGKLDLARHTDSTGKGARRGLVIGAVLGLIFPPSIIAAGVAGMGAGTVIGHSLNKIPRSDLKRVGDLIEEGQVALIVVAELQFEEMIRKAAKHAIREYKEQFNADVADYNKQLDAALKAV